MSPQPETMKPARPGSERADRRARAATPRRRLFADRVARWCVTGGGIAIIASILGILIFILAEVSPLAGGADITEARTVTAGPLPAGALLSDEYRTYAASLQPDGWIRFHDLENDELLERRPLLAANEDDPSADAIERAVPLSRIFPVAGDQALVAATTDGRLARVDLTWEISFDEQQRRITPRVSRPLVFELTDPEIPIDAAAVARDDEGTSTAVIVRGKRIEIERLEIEENLFSGEVTETRSIYTAQSPVPLERILLDRDQRNLFGATAAGDLVWWRLDAGEPDAGQRHRSDAGFTALSLLIGDRSLIAGHTDGSISVWFPVRDDDNKFHLTEIRRFSGLGSPIRLIAPSLRDKGFIAQSEQGRIGLFYSTSHRLLWSGTAPLPDASALFFTPKADGAIFADGNRLAELEIDNPHPEISLGALFGKVWYENYEEPEYVWQSTGGTDDFEPKLSLTPLLIGTLKGTAYSLFLAIPLGVLGAMYTSQFMHHSLKRYVKPTVEIMASLPSVVLGFLAGLWLAPRVEQVLPGLILMLVVLPAMVVTAGWLWRRLPLAIRNRYPTGVEAILQMVVVGVGGWLCLALNGPVERGLFGGSVRTWLLDTTGLPYDQRNAIVVGLAMGFAVIPIIFSIAEDAFSNVPRNLVSGSLALGADRWQTVTRVVLPSASPGIFSAIMIGFGRAVGETMIVLMATGNTPIMDWSPFNGFRTLSANIAVEIPEAPHGGTLYRALFLAALLLFLFTFATNTIAEIVRQRLRKRYAQI